MSTWMQRMNLDPLDKLNTHHDANVASSRCKENAPCYQDRTTLWMNLRKLVTNNGQGRFRKLTLDDFSMEHGVKDVVQQAITLKLERSKLQGQLQSARKESESLREYSRRRFQTVVDWESRQMAPSLHQPKAQIVSQIQITARRPNTTAGSTVSISGRPMSLTHPPQTPSTPTNGPTKDGSILYNSKPLLLSSIRTRPNSELPSRFNHMRGAHWKTYPHIQRTLELSNSEYRVGATHCHTARDDPHQADAVNPNFVMLIPMTSEADGVTTIGTGDVGSGYVRHKKGQAWTDELDGESPLLVSTARSRSPRSKDGIVKAGTREQMVVQGHADLSSREDVKVGSGRQTLTARDTSPATACSASGEGSVTAVRPVSTSSTASIQSMSPEAGKPPLQMTSSPVRSSVGRSQERQPQGLPVMSRLDSGKSQTSSTISTDSSVSITPRPHCWVDDVTISSDGSLADCNLSLQADLDVERQSIHSGQEPIVMGSTTGVGGAQVGQASSPRLESPLGAEKRKILPMGGGAKKMGSPLLKRSPSGTGGKAKGGGYPKQSTASAASQGTAKSQKALMGEGEVEVGEEEVVVLPRFMCPSSESKSRQAALKEWLAKTSFATACRTVPLM